MIDRAAVSASAEWQQGWCVVFASFVGFSFFSIMTASMSVFMEPIGAEFGWSRTLLSSGVMIASVTTAILSPFFGAVIDRFGSRRVALPGLALTTLAICCFSLANGSPTQWLGLWVFYAVISISVKTTVWTVAVARNFTRAQGLALGIMLTGNAASQTILPPLANALIESFGWRMAYVLLGGCWGGITLLTCFVFLRESKQTVPRTGHALNAPQPSGEKPGLTITEARKCTALWRVAISTLLVMILTIGLLVHQIPILTAAGITRDHAAWLASLAGISGIFGKLITGVLLDRFRPNWVGGLTLTATALSFALLLDVIATPTLIVLAMMVSGYAAGTKLQISSYLTARYVGLRNFGAIYGLITSLIALGSGLGPMLAGLIYDGTGAYTAFLVLGAAGCFLSAVLLMTLPAYPEWRQHFDRDEGPVVAGTREAGAPA